MRAVAMLVVVVALCVVALSNAYNSVPSRRSQIVGIKRGQSYKSWSSKTPNQQQQRIIGSGSGSGGRCWSPLCSVVEGKLAAAGSPQGRGDLTSTKRLTKHAKMIEGKLENGFSYIILPNATPEGRFEAHLEVLSGSANELERQQGMAHLLEHVAYMGSPKRQLISGTGSRTNAYTDFHHTVFFAACPTTTPDQFWKKPMLPMALDALLDVMTTTIDDDRLEKERAAVLSEASMVNKMEYRVECQILSSLHSENRIAQRFPIGKVPMIKAWKKEDLQLYHHTHYRPDNVVLFVVGDVDPATTIETISQKFGHLQPKIDAPKLLKDSGEFPELSMRSLSRHFPPVLHEWSVDDASAAAMNIPQGLIKPAELQKTALGPTKLLPESKLFKHELLQSFSFHLFAKRPIEPIVTERALRRDLMKRMCLSALQIRLNVNQRQDPLFTFVDFNQINWPREGCAVCSLDLTTEIHCWKEAVTLAVKEIRRLGLFGLTDSEVDRYKKAIYTEAAQAVAQGDQMGNEDVLNELMEAEANGHVYMHPQERLAATERAIASITADEVRLIARELSEHLSHIDPAAGIRPAAVIACAPLMDRDGLPFVVTDADVSGVIEAALLEPLEALENKEVPATLITKEEMAEKREKTRPAWIPLDGKALKDGAARKKLGINQKKLSNGMRVNLLTLESEPQRVSLRLYVPGGRMLENKAPGAVLLGSRTLQEGGAFLKMNREEVELFCIDHMVMVDIVALDDALVFDFQTVTTLGLGGEVTGLEAVMQVAHIIMTDVLYEEDAFERARQSFHEQFDSIVKGLETACQESLIYSLTGGDPRFLAPNHKQIDSLDLATVKSAITSQLNPSTVEVSVSGDVPMEQLEALCLDYFGTIPPSKSRLGKNALPSSESIKIKTLGRSQQLGVYLPDLDERAMGYLAGASPNKWGIFANGDSIADRMVRGASGEQNKRDERRDNPLFGYIALQILQEVANRRLFSVVREERQLTYDASFQLMGHDSIMGGWFLVSVTSSPQQVQEAIRACKEALASLRGAFGVMGDSVQSAKRTILNKYRTGRGTNAFWMENLSGTQCDAVPHKSLQSISDFETVLQAVTVGDIQQLVELLAFEEDSMTACVGVTSAKPPADMKM